MITTSAEFKTNIDADQRRPEVYVAVHFGKKAYIPSATATSQFDTSTAPSQAAIGRIRPNDFTSSGHAKAGYINRHKGWWSGAVSSVTGTFTTAQELIINYGEVIESQNFWFNADSFYYPVDFDVCILNTSTGAWDLITSVAGNNNNIWSFRNSTIKQFQQVKLVVKKVFTPNQNVRVYHFGAVTTVIFEKDHIIDFKLLEETKSESMNPVGFVTSNEFTLSLTNELKWFTLDNTSSPFYGLIRPNIVVEPYIGVETTVDNIEFVPLGKFMIRDWGAPTAGVESSIIANDKLFDLLAKDIPMKLPMRNTTTLKDLFIYLFSSLGLTGSDYQIDDTISYNIPKAWLTEGQAGSLLQTLAEAGNCSVFVDRFDIIKVKNNKQSGTSVASLNDNNQIVSIDNPQRFLNMFTSVKVDYNNYYLAEIQQIGFLEKRSLAVGDNTFTNIRLNGGPIGNVSYVKLINSKFTTVKEIKMGTWSIDLILTSTTAETIDIVIYGRPLSSNTIQIESKDQTLINSWGEKIFTLRNPYIQNGTVAKNYCDSLLRFVSDPKSYYSISTRGNPSLELLDLIDIQSTIDNIGPTQLTIIKNELTYDGGLSGFIYARKVIS